MCLRWTKRWYWSSFHCHGWFCCWALLTSNMRTTTTEQLRPLVFCALWWRCYFLRLPWLFCCMWFELRTVNVFHFHWYLQRLSFRYNGLSTELSWRIHSFNCQIFWDAFWLALSYCCLWFIRANHNMRVHRINCWINRLYTEKIKLCIIGAKKNILIGFAFAFT